MPLDACSDPTPPARPATRSAARVLARSTALLLLIGCGLAYPRVVTDKDTPPEWRTKSQHARLPPVVVDPALPDYKPVKGLAGTIHSVGSSGLSNLLLRWSDEFKNIYPQVTIAIEAVGSDKAVAALVDGQAEIAPMSRASVIGLPRPCFDTASASTRRNSWSRRMRARSLWFSKGQ